MVGDKRQLARSLLLALASLLMTTTVGAAMLRVGAFPSEERAVTEPAPSASP
jgi:hypothetical protein